MAVHVAARDLERRTVISMSRLSVSSTRRLRFAFFRGVSSCATRTTLLGASGATVVRRAAAGAAPAHAPAPCGSGAAVDAEVTRAAPPANASVKGDVSPAACAPRSAPRCTRRCVGSGSGAAAGALAARAIAPSSTPLSRLPANAVGTAERPGAEATLAPAALAERRRLRERTCLRCVPHIWHLYLVCVFK